ncbi:MAG: putative cytokinetic ring protein SteA [Acidimicrobiales bacterium]
MLRRAKKAAPQGIAGRARVGKRTKDLIKRLEPGEIAVIDHADLDRVAADGLVAARVAAVVNAQPSVTGRYPNQGPLRILAAGIPLVDEVGSELLDALEDGQPITVAEGDICVGGGIVASGNRRTREDLEAVIDEAKRTIGAELQRFAENTLEYVRREAELTFAPLKLPPLHTKIDGRHVLVVVRGHDYKEDLRALRPYIAEYRPVLIGVDGGADALLEQRMKPDMIIGDFDSVTAGALDVAKDLIHHVHPSGHNPGFEELQDFGVDYEEFVVEGTSEDAAMILAHEAGADLIVAVGTHATMIEFLDKGRPGMASTFLTRLRLGPTLVDAKGVSRLYRARISGMSLVVMLTVGLLALGVALWSTDGGRALLQVLGARIDDLWSSLQGVFG